MAEYEVKKLYSATTNIGPESVTYESMWAYYITFDHTDSSIPGRFRIRITRMTSNEWLSLMGMDNDDVTDSVYGYSIQGYVEKWSDKGWLQCIDWLGDPESNIETIEQDLLEMYEAFTTGKSLDSKFSKPVPQPPRPRPKNTRKVKPNLITFPTTQVEKKSSDNINSGSSSSSKDDDFDWV